MKLYYVYQIQSLVNPISPDLFVNTILLLMFYSGQGIRYFFTTSSDFQKRYVEERADPKQPNLSVATATLGDIPEIINIGIDINPPQPIIASTKPVIKPIIRTKKYMNLR